MFAKKTLESTVGYYVYSVISQINLSISKILRARELPEYRETEEYSFLGILNTSMRHLSDLDSFIKTIDQNSLISQQTANSYHAQLRTVSAILEPLRDTTERRIRKIEDAAKASAVSTSADTVRFLRISLPSHLSNNREVPSQEKISVIKLIREITGWGLKESKDASENLPITLPVQVKYNEEQAAHFISNLRGLGVCAEIIKE